MRKERSVEVPVRFFEAPVSVDNIAGGTPADSASPAVGTLVEIPTPAGVTLERLAEKFKAAVPTYPQVPGLLRKHFAVSPSGDFGGLSLWQDEARARACFGDAWHTRVVRTSGQDANIERFDAPILLPSQDAAHLAAARALLRVAP